MNPESLARLQKPPHQSFFRERFLSTELHRRLREERNLEENIAALALFVAFGDNFYDARTTRSSLVLPAECAWLPEMIYKSDNPDDEHVYSFNESSPEGLCFPTTGVLSVATMWSELVKTKQVKEVYIEDGTLLYTPKKGEKEVISDHHGWVRVVANDDREWAIDLTAYQFMPQLRDPNGHIRVVMKGLHGNETDPTIPGVNWRVFAHADDKPVVVPNAWPLEFQPRPEKSMRLGKRNTKKWKDMSGGRVELLLGAMGLEPGIDLGGQEKGVALENSWHPQGFNHKKLTEGFYLAREKYDVDSPTSLSLEEASQLVQAGYTDETKLSIEGLGVLLRELARKCSNEMLMKWAMGGIEILSDYVAMITDDPHLHDTVASMQVSFDRKDEVPDELLGQLAWKRSDIKRRMRSWPKEQRIYLEYSLQAMDVIEHILGIVRHRMEYGQNYVALLRDVINACMEDTAQLIDTIGLSLDVRPSLMSIRYRQYMELHDLYQRNLETSG